MNGMNTILVGVAGSRSVGFVKVAKVPTHASVNPVISFILAKKA